MKIVVNPGHDKVLDPGAIGSTGLHEADVAHDVGKVLKTLLESAGHEVKFLQDNFLMGVINESNAWGADILVSIHCNGFASPSAQGTETLYYPTSAQGKKLAECLQKSMVETFALVDRGIKERRDLGVLKYTSMPAALVEMAFITNPREEKILRDGTQAWARALYEGIKKYIESEV